MKNQFLVAAVALLLASCPNNVSYATKVSQPVTGGGTITIGNRKKQDIASDIKTRTPILIAGGDKKKDFCQLQSSDGGGTGVTGTTLGGKKQDFHTLEMSNQKLITSKQSGEPVLSPKKKNDYKLLSEGGGTAGAGGKKQDFI